MGPQTLWNEYFYRNLTTSTMGWTKDQLQRSWCQGPEIAPPAAAKVDSFAWDGRELLDGGSVRECRDTTFFFSSLLKFLEGQLGHKTFWKCQIHSFFPANPISNSEFGHSPLLSGCISTALLVIRWKRAVELCMAPSSRETPGTTPFSSTNPLALVWALMWIIRTAGLGQAESFSQVDPIVTQAWRNLAWLFQVLIMIYAYMLDFDGYLGNDSSTKRKPMTMAIHSKSALSFSWPKVKYNGLQHVSASLGAQDGETLLIEVINPGLVQVRRWGAVLGVRGPCLCWTMFKMNSQGHTWLVTARIQVSILWLSAEAHWL